MNQGKVDSNWSWSIGITGAVLLTALAIGPLAATGYGQLSVLISLVGIAVFLMLTQPRAAVILVTTGAFSFEYLAGQGLLPEVAIWAMDILILLLFSRALVVKKHTTNAFFQDPISKIGLVWLVLMLMSAIINSTSPLQSLLGLRPYVRFIFLYYCLLEFDWSEQFLKQSLYLVTLLFLVQIPIAMLQKVTGFSVDAVSGTIAAGGGTGIISVAAMAFFVGLFGYAMFDSKPLFLLAAFGVLFLPILATARAFVFVVPLVGLFVSFKLGLYKKGVWLIIFTLSTVLLLSSWNLTYGSFKNLNAFDLLQNPSIALAELDLGPVQDTSGASIGRFQGLDLTWTRISSSWDKLLLGYGPKSAQGSRFSFLQPDLYDTLSRSGGRASELTRVLLEWGILGVLAYASIYILMWFAAEEIYSKAHTPFWKATSLSYSAFILLSLGLSIYTSTWSATLLGFLFWFVGGILKKVGCSQETPKR